MQARYRLTQNSSFGYIYRNGQSVANKHMVILYVKTKYTLKVGFSVSKKIGNSVVRNRVKRRLKECFRSLIPNLNKKYNYIIVARDASADASYQELFRGMTALLKRIGVYEIGEDNDIR